MRFVIFMAGERPELGEMCIRSIRHHHRDAEIVHASDEETPILRGADTIWRRHDTNPIRLRTMHLAAMDNTPTVSIDTDTLVCASLEPIWRHDFDVALTTRPYDRTSYNCGVMFTRCAAFWQAFYEYMRARWGSFLAMEENMPAFIKGWNVLPVPSEIWNCSTFKDNSRGHAKVLHFKGDRKPLMPVYYRLRVWE